jgi:hypothetical protein
MISNALPKMINLRRVHITMRWKDLQQILKMLHLHCFKLSGLSIEYAKSRDPLFVTHKFVSDLPMELESSFSLGLLT